MPHVRGCVLICGALLVVGFAAAQVAEESPTPAEASSGSVAGPPADRAPEGPNAPAPEDGARREAAHAPPDDTTLETNRATIGAVLIRIGDIFDPEIPEENRKLFRAANRVHRRTRENVVRRLLLFETGDRYSRRLMDESERILRKTKYLYDAQIKPVRYENNRVDVEVVTRDIWTLRPSLGFSRTGGENTTRLGLKDSNFLGTGREVGIRRISDVDRTSVSYSYFDPNLRGRRVEVGLRYDDNTDGSGSSLVVQRPFFSLDARWAAGVVGRNVDLTHPLYDRGEVFEEFRQRSETYLGFFGRSRGLVDGSARRWRGGFAYQRDRFEPIPGVTASPVPEDRTLAYPWVGFRWIKDGFVEVHDLDQIYRTEDLNLGHDLNAWIGWSSEAFGGDRDRGVFALTYRIGSSPRPGHILRLRTHASGRLYRGRGENVLAGGSLSYCWRNLGRHLFYVELSLEGAHRLDGERQLLLGGDSGLRGYPLRYLSGDRRLLLSLEQRFYSKRHPFRLARIGGAVFFDVGGAWFGGSAASDDTLYKDIGFGLRIGSSRSSSAAMLHIDLAFPLDGDGSVDSVQFLVKTRDTF